MNFYTNEIVEDIDSKLRYRVLIDLGVTVIVCPSNKELNIRNAMPLIKGHIKRAASFKDYFKTVKEYSESKDNRNK